MTATQNFDETRTPEGLLIKALALPDLLAMSDRCEAYVAECERRGVQVKPEKREICEAVYYYLAQQSPEPDDGSIAGAFTEFSLLRRQLLALGYTPQPIVGTPPAREIRAVCDVLRAALRAHTPLPGEPPELTRRISEESAAAITSAIDEINAGREKPRQFSRE